MANGQKDLVLEELENGVMRLILNDEKRRNALSENMLDTLHEKIMESAKNPKIRVVIISAKGPVFCAGHDLKEITQARDYKDDGIIYFQNLFDKCSEVMKGIVTNPKPVIAEVNGIATAAGCQLVASCDLAIASDASKFATPGVNIGLFCSTPMVALTRNVNKKDAMKMLLTGEMIDAVEAKRISLINDYFNEDELSKEVMELANKISSKPMMTVHNGKHAFYKQYEMNLSDAYKYTSKVMASNALSEDAKEGIGSFLEKRTPNWKNKNE